MRNQELQIKSTQKIIMRSTIQKKNQIINCISNQTNTKPKPKPNTTLTHYQSPRQQCTCVVDDKWTEWCNDCWILIFFLFPYILYGYIVNNWIELQVVMVIGINSHVLGGWLQGLQPLGVNGLHWKWGGCRGFLICFGDRRAKAWHSESVWIRLLSNVWVKIQQLGAWVLFRLND